MERKTKAILFSLLAFVGFSGVGHFYLNRFRSGLKFLLVGVFIEIVPALMIAIFMSIIHDICPHSYVPFYATVISGSFMFSISLISILKITKQNNIE